MNLKLLQQGTLPACSPENWCLELEIPENVSGNLLRIYTPDQQELMACVYREGQLEVSLYYSARESPLILRSAIRTPKTVTVSGTSSKVILLSDGKLLDEEWPLGKILFENALYIAMVQAVFQDVSAKEPEFVPEYFTGISSWKPSGENTYIGDCMPFADGDTYRIFYLFDRRHHKSKWGLGAHRWAQVSSRDLVHWRTHPIAIGIDEQFEGSICTGSHIRFRDRYYAFYAVRMSDYSPARLTWAVSTDGEHFEKSGQYITLTAPYESVSARDPKVFLLDDGQFHMLVTTSIAEHNVGALAHLVSKDLEHWEQLPPLVVLDIADQPECSDFIRFGDWYYLIYSNFGRAKWYKSKSPLGPWEAPDDNLVAAQNVGVPKGAFLNDRLIFTGFTKDGRGYGGNFVLYEAFQDSNGNLTFQKLNV